VGADRIGVHLVSHTVARAAAEAAVGAGDNDAVSGYGRKEPWIGEKGTMAHSSGRMWDPVSRRQHVEG